MNASPLFLRHTSKAIRSTTIIRQALHGTKDILTVYHISTIEITDEKFFNEGEDKLQRTLVNTNNETDTVNGMLLELTAKELVQADGYEPSKYK